MKICCLTICCAGEERRRDFRVVDWSRSCFEGMWLSKVQGDMGCGYNWRRWKYMLGMLVLVGVQMKGVFQNYEGKGE